MTTHADLVEAKYVAFTSFKNDGTPVNTPVWIVEFEEGFAFTTESTSYKVARIRRHPRISVQPSDVRGRPKPGSQAVAGSAEIVTGDRYRQVESAIRGKYTIGMRVLGVWETMSGLFRRNRADTVAIKIVIDG